jgi:hypothetical protein
LLDGHCLGYYRWLPDDQSIHPRHDRRAARIGTICGSSMPRIGIARGQRAGALEMAAGMIAWQVSDLLTLISSLEIPGQRRLAAALRAEGRGSTRRGEAVSFVPAKVIKRSGR